MLAARSNVIPIVMLALTGCGRLGFDEGSSCVALPPTCGPTGTSNCCESAVVAGGTFYRSYDVAADMAFPNASWPATVTSFELDTYEVTVGRFRKFVEAGMGTEASPPAAGAGARTLDGVTNQGGWDPAWNASLAANTEALVAALACDATYQTWTDTPAGNEDRPIGCITWYEAMAFCVWDRGYLPTEAESMYAASGGSQQRAYPWSSPADSTAIDCTVASYAACLGALPDPVGSVSPQGDGVWGQADLSGSIWEWVLDWYVSPLPTPCNDCANLVQAAFERGIRGGGFTSLAPTLRAANRYKDVPTIRSYRYGVRCARNGL